MYCINALFNNICVLIDTLSCSMEKNLFLLYWVAVIYQFCQTVAFYQARKHWFQESVVTTLKCFWVFWQFIQWKHKSGAFVAEMWLLHPLTLAQAHAWPHVNSYVKLMYKLEPHGGLSRRVLDPGSERAKLRTDILPTHCISHSIHCRWTDVVVVFEL